VVLSWRTVRAAEGDSSARYDGRGVHLFHYHLVTSKVRPVEARQLGRSDLVARHGWIGENTFEEVPDGASDRGLKIQGHPGKRTFIGTNAGLRVEVRPPRDSIEDTLERRCGLRLAELRLRAGAPGLTARALADVLGLEPLGSELLIGESLVRFDPGGPEGRPELVGEGLE
jgi:hypothetical protein